MYTLFGEASSAEPLSLVHAASRAASSHNSQPWAFQLGDNVTRILPDLRRRCPVVDPDDHHLYASLGCATENLVVAANASGLDTEVMINATESINSCIEVRLRRGLTQNAVLARAIDHRQCSRARYERRPVPTDALATLERAANDAGVNAIFITDTPRKAAIADYVAQGNTQQLEDERWRQELVTWLRFNEREARQTGDGLWSRTTGNPNVPRLLGKTALPLFLNPRAQNGKDVPWTRDSAGVVVFVANKSDITHWVTVGRCYERFALQATALGISNTFINQPVEVPALRQQFATWLGLGERRPDLIVRFGYGPVMPASMRRPLKDVICDPGYRAHP